MTDSAHPPVYRGRFAPTPSGPLHFGSLVAAMGSYLDARAASGQWLVRMEDPDPPRVAAGAADAILRSLERHGFQWEGPVLHQSRRGAAYQAAVDRLQAGGLVYGCRCSRKRLAETAMWGVDGPVYPGTCRHAALDIAGLAVRLRVPDSRICFVDRLLGRVACDVARECGDFPIRRADGVYTYQLAVVVDDAEQGITHVVRGADLLASTPRQIVLQHSLELPTPDYMHLPLVLDAAGDKLSKQTLAAPLDDREPLAGLRAAAAFLGLGCPDGLANSQEFWSWATAAWPTACLPPMRGYRPRAESLCNS